MMLQKKTVTGAIALDYLKMVLGRGGKLSSYIGRLPLSQGEISAFVPLSTPDEEISLALLEQFASKVVRFFVMAYDYEGYLIWSLSNEEMES
jgi:hypothetical protein